MVPGLERGPNPDPLVLHHGRSPHQAAASLPVSLDNVKHGNCAEGGRRHLTASPRGASIPGALAIGSATGDTDH